MLKRFIKDERGLETVEWVVMAALIVLGITAAVTTLQGKIGGVFTDLGTEIDSASDAAPPAGG